jgi:hypothetical protein
MRAKIIWGAMVLLAWLALAPAPARAQSGQTGPAQSSSLQVPDFLLGNTLLDQSTTGTAPQPPYIARAQVGTSGGAAGYVPADPIIPLPLGSSHPEQGGLFLFGEYVFRRQTNPLKGQPVAIRGFEVVDNSIPGVAPGTFFGSKALALDVSQVSGPNQYEPGFSIGGGWKFSDGTALTVGFTYLAEHRTTAVATVAPPGLRVGPQLEDSFLFAPVFNFPFLFSGPANKISAGSPQAVFGIWNGASNMTEEFIQRYQQWDIAYRIPVYDTECFRLTGLMGPRFVWIWERYKWVTEDLDVNGDPSPVGTAAYTNITSNRMYGAHLGATCEYYMGHGFACMVTGEGALFIDSVKKRAQYEIVHKFTGAFNKRAQHDWTLAAETNAFVSLMWYPTEFIQIQLGYDIMAFFNTLSSPQPIDIDYSSLNPKWESTTRFIDGFRIGVSFIF